MEEELIEKIRQAFKNGHGEPEKPPSNGHSKPPPEHEEGGERGLVRNDPIPGDLSPKIKQAIALTLEREEQGMVRSWAKRTAQENLQRALDAHRANEAVRLKVDLEDLRLKCLVERLEYVKREGTAHPELEAYFWESLASTNDFFVQVARLVPVAYLRRYYDLGTDHARDQDPYR